MTALATTIVSLYETSGLDVDAISVDQGIDKNLVISTLLNFSTKFREDSNKEDLELVSKAELKEFLGDYKQIARYAEDENLRARCLKDLINVGLKVSDGLGMNDPKKLLREVGGSGNIYDLQLIIQQARAAKQRVLANVDKIIDVQIEEKATA